MLPNVSINKADGNTGVVAPSADGVLVIIAPSEKGTLNQPSGYARADLAFTDYGQGKLTEGASYVMSVSKKPVVLIRGAGSTAGSNGTVAHVGAGTSVVTATGTPFDDYDAQLVFIAGATIGVAGATFKYSLDGGTTYSGVIALGTATTYTIPGSGCTFAFAAGTVLAGQTESFKATGPKLTNSDLVTSLEALRVYGGSYDAILILGMNITSTEVATLDAWLALREGEGKFKTVVGNAIARDQATQTEAQYATAMTTAFASSSFSVTRSGVVCADAVYIPAYRGNRATQPVALAVAARGMAFDLSVDAAFVANGPVAGCQISDDRGNPKFHDEALYPGLDDLRLTTLRTFPGRVGPFVDNANLLSPSGSDYVYWQHARVMNRACEITYGILTGRLSQGVRKDLSSGYILEEDAQEIEGLVNAELAKQLTTPARVSGAAFKLSRTDDLTSNVGATLNGEVQVSALSYIKKFAIVSRFTKKITVSA